MSTPTPRTDAAWSATFDGEQMSAGRTARALRECSQQLETELAALTAERDQLRADANEAHAATHHWCNRAELAEAALADAQPKSDHYMASWLERAAARAEKAERDLATERARLDWLISGGVCMIQHTGGFHVSRLHAPVSRAAIDAAMQEDAK